MRVQKNHYCLARPTSGVPKQRVLLLACLNLLLLLAVPLPAVKGQGGSGHTLFGDLKVEDRSNESMKPISFDIILYSLGGLVVARQKVANGGRYRFNSLRSGEYNLAVEVDSVEVARLPINLGGGMFTDNRQDIELEWRSNKMGRSSPAKKQTVSAEDFYERSAANRGLFEKAQQAIDKKKFDEGIALLKKLLDADGKDFQAWSELGTIYVSLNKTSDAEKSYARAVEEKPTFFLALLNLGRVRVSQKQYEAAIEPLTRAVELQPESADANFLLGQSYLQLKKGSKAVGYLNEASKLGRYEAHLLLAALYNAVGMKDKAVIEYEEFLKKQPDYPDRKKLEQFIGANKKSQ
ncbi:MAG TPA: tetratricopeptide repeat protein [Pyrinomonadaceae bacterium]|nr:tetratricopeptide repeat protein [Pyrinomonadaceae bacterium]